MCEERSDEHRRSGGLLAVCLSSDKLGSILDSFLFILEGSGRIAIWQAARKAGPPIPTVGKVFLTVGIEHFKRTVELSLVGELVVTHLILVIGVVLE